MTTLIEDDLNSIMADAADMGAPTVTLAGVEYACEPGDMESGLAPLWEGDVPDLAATVLVPASAFATGVEPTEGMRAEYEGDAMRVVRVQKSLDGIEYQLGLSSPQK